MEPIYIAGIAMTEFGRHPDRSLQDLALEALNGALFERIMRLRPPLVDIGKAEVLADRLLEQARANHDKLVQV